jgi:hypothetical protein
VINTTLSSNELPSLQEGQKLLFFCHDGREERWGGGGGGRILADKTTLTRTIAHFPSDSPGGVGRREGGQSQGRCKMGGEDAGVLTER